MVFRRGRSVGQSCKAALALCGLAIAWHAPGCQKEAQPAAEAKPNSAAVQSAENGGVSLSVRSNRSQVRIAEPVELTIEATAPPDVELQWPEAETHFEGFHVRRSGTVETASSGEQEVTWRQTLELESFTSGRRDLPGVSVAFPGGEVSTAPIPLEVVSAVEGEVDPTAFDDIAGPVSLARPPDRRWIYWTVGGVVAALLAGLGVWWFVRSRRRRAAIPPPPPPPHQWALDSLERLLAERLIEAGQVQEFFYRLSGIVRTYIELRFGLHAPEQTTAEFLNELQQGNELRFGHKDLLGDFLTSCDLVKYALHRPEGSHIDASIDAARRFIQETTASTAPEPVEGAV
jgi:hypothetical protein